MSDENVLTVFWVISVLSSVGIGALIGYREADRYWRGKDKWYNQVESIQVQMEQDGWPRP